MAEALGRAQAVLTVVGVLGAVVLVAWGLAVRGRQPSGGAPVLRGPLAWAISLYLVGSGAALLTIGLLQLLVDRAPYAAFNVLLGVSILLIVVRGVRRARQ